MIYNFNVLSEGKKYCINKVSMALTLWGLLRMIIYPETNGEEHPASDSCCVLLAAVAPEAQSPADFTYLNINFCCVSHNLMAPQEFSVSQTLCLTS